jgi:heterodisulfide reductase subunit A2
VVETSERGLRVAVDDGASRKIAFHDLDMLVLAVGMKPSKTTKKIQEMLGLQLSPDGFFLEAHPKLQPVDAATRGIFFAGCAEGPKDIKDSVTQGSAAAARMVRLLHRGEMLSDPITAEVVTEKCKICGKCAEVCPYGAISVDVKRKVAASVNPAACAGCGTCAAECPFDSIVMNHFTDEQIVGQIDNVLSESPSDRILAFACNWCSYAGADYAGVSRLQYPPTVRLIRTMCSGRVDESFIWEGFAKGAPVILVSGCHIGDCHYINANQWTVARIDKIRKKMEKLAIRPERLQLEWISAAEGGRFARLMEEMEKLRRGVTAEEITETVRVLAENPRKKDPG